MARPMSKLRFIKSFRPAVRQYIKDMYDKYLALHPLKSVWALAGKDVALGSIPWVAIPTGIAALLRRDMYNTPELRWSSAKWIGGTALLSALLRTAYALPKAYKEKKLQLPLLRAIAAQLYIINLIQKNASLNDVNKVGTQAWWKSKWDDSKATIGSFALPGLRGDSRRMYALGGIGLLAALLSGGGLGRALLLGVLGLGAGYALNKWVLPRVNGWQEGAKFLDGVSDRDLYEELHRKLGLTVVNRALGQRQASSLLQELMDTAANTITKVVNDKTSGKPIDVEFKNGLARVETPYTGAKADLVAAKNAQRPDDTYIP